MMPLVATPGGASGETAWTSHLAAPGKYASSGTPGLNWMWGIIPFFHCPRSTERISELVDGWLGA